MLLGGIVVAASGCGDPESPSVSQSIPALAASSAAAPLSFRQLSAGYRHTCGVTTNNRAYCWGLNDRGQLGEGTTTDRLTPVPVTGGLQFSGVSPNGHSCGVTTNRRAYCGGFNAYAREVHDRWVTAQQHSLECYKSQT